MPKLLLATLILFAQSCMGEVARPIQEGFIIDKEAFTLQQQVDIAKALTDWYFICPHSIPPLLESGPPNVLLDCSGEEAPFGYMTICPDADVYKQAFYNVALKGLACT